MKFDSRFTYGVDFTEGSHRGNVSTPAKAGVPVKHYHEVKGIGVTTVPGQSQVHRSEVS